MRIGIDARFYGSMGKGLGRYVSELLAQLEKLDSKNEYLVFLRRDNFDEYRPQAPNFKKIKAEFPWYGWKEQLLYPAFLKRHRLDLMHFAHFNVPLLYHRPFIVTVHDLILIDHPTPRATTLGPLLYRLKYFLYRQVIRRAVRDAKKIITVSNFSREQILKRFPFLRPEKIAVTYEACAEPLRQDGSRGKDTAADAADRQEMSDSIQPPFALYVGSAYPHKNLEQLIEAFAAFRRQDNEDWKLVLVGGSDYFYDRLQQETKAKKLIENVIFFGKASDDELADLYRQADFYVFPSLYEGFGLPPLEAMNAGLPVTAAAASCLPEILDGAADWFVPTDIRDITGALVRMAHDVGLRQRLAAAGRQQAAKYSWRECALKTLEIYKT